MKNDSSIISKAQLLEEIRELRYQLNEANETIDAIRTGQVDALVVHSQNGHQLYTLKTADQTYRVFIEKMAEGAVTIDKRGFILYCNTQFAAIVNCSISDVIGSPFEKYVAEKDKGVYADLFSKGWEADCKSELNLQSGSKNVVVQLSATTLQLDEGKSLSIIVTDLTTQKESQQLLIQKNLELEQSNRALETSNHDLQQFASIASHDLQEPIRKIQIFSSLLKDMVDDLPSEARAHLDKIANSSTRMRTLVTEILNYSKLSANDHNIQRIDLNDIVDDLRDHFELVLEEKGAILKTGNLPVIAGNTGQIRQMFQNLVSNSLKFSKDDLPPVIEILSTTIADKSFDAGEANDGDFALISIKDNGIGFDGRYVDNIFSLFERLNPKDRYEGAGIGLAIAKKIVEKHSGLITAISTEGEGAIFKIILPIYR